jgi:hypothetical protein
VDSPTAAAPRERTQPVAQLILGVPGRWATRSELVTDIATKSHGLVLAGTAVRDDTSGEIFGAEVAEHEPRLVQAFLIAGRGSLEEEDLQAIEAHRYMVYVVGEGHSRDGARTMLRIGAGLLDAGGIAVKVESSGVAHSARAWRTLAQDGDDAALYRAYVTLIGSQRGVYSCGMHAMGMRDAFVVGIDAQAAGRVAEAFLLYALIDQPALHEGETFSAGQGEPTFRLAHQPCDTFLPDNPFYNPWGYWLLTPL